MHLLSRVKTDTHYRRKKLLNSEWNASCKKVDYLALLQVLEETKRLRKAKETEQEWQCDRLWPLVD